MEEILMMLPEPAFRKLQIFFSKLSSDQIDRLYSMQSGRAPEILELSKPTMHEFIRSTINDLWNVSKDLQNIHFRKQYADRFIIANTKVYISEYGRLSTELCPSFRQYYQNINTVCQSIYEYLCSEEGSELMHQLQKSFGDTLDLINYNHGLLESIVNIPLLQTCLNE